MPLNASIIIPIYRDSKNIAETIDTLMNFLHTEQIQAEVIVVNDGGEREGVHIIQKKMEIWPTLSLIDRTVNKGKGYTVREGMQKAQGTYIFFTDADLPYTAKPIRTMLTMLSSRQADLIIANRNLPTGERDEKPSPPRRLAHIIYSWFIRFLLPIRFTDTLAGLKAIRKEVMDAILPKLTIDRYSFDVEIILATLRTGFTVKEIPVSLRNIGHSNLAIRRDAPQMIREVIHIWNRDRKGAYL